VQASLGAVQAEYRALQLALVNSRHQHVQRAAISGFQFQAVHRGLLNGRNAEREQTAGRTKERWVNRLRLPSAYRLSKRALSQTRLHTRFAALNESVRAIVETSNCCDSFAQGLPNGIVLRRAIF
jgi:hypothetical protein